MRSADLVRAERGPVRPRGRVRQPELLGGAGLRPIRRRDPEGKAWALAQLAAEVTQ
ncbi:hypothetical protein ABZ552_05595 [Nocardia sp. NPDC019219]|uniref:hypothetical protein n=1 Tax=Nocardia sp. NPDC019219 TaxID=3154590 RepID=UPI003408C7DC